MLDNDDFQSNVFHGHSVTENSIYYVNNHEGITLSLSLCNLEEESILYKVIYCSRFPNKYRILLAQQHIINERKRCDAIQLEYNFKCPLMSSRFMVAMVYSRHSR